MIALYILGGLVLLLALIGSIKLSVRVGYAAQGPLVIVKIAFFSLRLLDGKKPRKKGRAGIPKKESEQPAHKKKKKQKQPKPYTGEPVQLTQMLTAWRDVALGLFRQLGKHWKIELLRLRVLVATDDAARTALLYGTVCALVQPVQLLARGAPRVNRKKVLVSVNSDFLADKPELDAELCVSTRVWRMAWVALRSAKPIYDAYRLLKGYQFQAKNQEQDEANKEKAERNGDSHDGTTKLSDEGMD